MTEAAERQAGLLYPDARILADSLALLRRAGIGPFRNLGAAERPAPGAYPMFQPPPDRVTSEVAVERQRVQGEDVLMVHAPGEVRFRLPAGLYRLTATFGIRPEAYAPGRTDGVEFSVTRVEPDGTERRLFGRFLDPLRIAADRGPQALDVVVEAGERSEVALRTAPGPARDTSWDWSFWTGVRFETLGDRP